MRDLRIAALFVQPDGCYVGLPHVDPWDEARDARTYDGDLPVVAHPPCARWGRYWGGGPSAKVPRRLGDDGGCFAAALDAVRRCGGVIEHPEASHAWRVFGLPIPHRAGGWQLGLEGGASCCVEQGAYGHRARKATWLYAFGVNLPPLRWGKAPGNFVRLDQGFHSTAARERSTAEERHPIMSGRELSATPIPFRDLLISIAMTAHA